MLCAKFGENSLPARNIIFLCLLTQIPNFLLTRRKLNKKFSCSSSLTMHNKPLNSVELVKLLSICQHEKLILKSLVRRNVLVITNVVLCLT